MGSIQFSNPRGNKGRYHIQHKYYCDYYGKHNYECHPQCNNKFQKEKCWKAKGVQPEVLFCLLQTLFGELHWLKYQTSSHSTRCWMLEQVAPVVQTSHHDLAAVGTWTWHAIVKLNVMLNLNLLKLLNPVMSFSFLAHWPAKPMTLTNHQWQMTCFGICMWTLFRWSI